MLITHANIITWEKPNRIYNDYAILVKDGQIRRIGPHNLLLKDFRDEEKLDARSQFVLPGNICSHTHFYGAFARGMGIPGKPPRDFPEILSKLWWPLDKSLREDDIRFSTLVCLIDAIRHGTTTLFDHHASPNCITGSLDIIADVVDRLGVRASLCYEVTDRDGQARSLAGLDENLRFISSIDSRTEGRFASAFGLHASLTLDDATLDKCGQAIPQGVGFHIHAAEHIVDEYDSLQKSGMRVIERLHHHNILGPNTIVAHAVNVDPREMGLLAETGTWVSHQPRSNMNNGVGLPDIDGMLRLGIKVCMGNDGFSNAMWEEWQAAYLSHKLIRSDPQRMSANDVIQMGVYNNSELASTQFKRKIGVIEEGAEADLIFVDYHPFTPINTENLAWHIMFGFRESMVTTTIVAGKILMKDRELIDIDEEQIAFQSRELAKKMWMNYQNSFN